MVIIKCNWKHFVLWWYGLCNWYEVTTKLPILTIVCIEEQIICSVLVTHKYGDMWAKKWFFLYSSNASFYSQPIGPAYTVKIGVLFACFKKTPGCYSSFHGNLDIKGQLWWRWVQGKVSVIYLYSNRLTSGPKERTASVETIVFFCRGFHGNNCSTRMQTALQF